ARAARSTGRILASFHCMNSAAVYRLFDPRGAFDAPVVLWLCVATAAMLLVAPLIIRALAAAGTIAPVHGTELMARYRSWLVIVAIMALPVLLGAAFTIAGVAILCLLCYREYARATGLFREKLVSAIVASGILLTALAALDNWYAMFVALWPLTTIAIAALAV